MRRQAEPRGILISKHYECRAGIGHEGGRAIVDGGFEHEMSARVGLEPYLAGKARRLRPALVARSDRARGLCAGTKRALEVVEEIEHPEA